MTALVIDGHPNPASLTAAMGRAYAAGHGDATVLSLRELDFDLNLRLGYTGRIPLEPDLADAKRAMHAASRIVIATPLWWGSTPALLKGFFDRALLPGEEYTYRGVVPVGLLAGRRGRVLVLADTPRAFLPITGLPVRTQVRRNTLALCGIRRAPVNTYPGVRSADEGRIARWLDDAGRLGERDARRDAGMPTPAPWVGPFADEVQRAGASRDT